MIHVCNPAPDDSLLKDATVCASGDLRLPELLFLGGELSAGHQGSAEYLVGQAVEDVIT